MIRILITYLLLLVANIVVNGKPNIRSPGFPNADFPKDFPKFGGSKGGGPPDGMHE